MDAPTTATLLKTWEPTTTPSALFYDADAAFGDAGLWVAEYQEPIGLGSDWQENEEQGMGDVSASACPKQSVSPDDPVSNATAGEELVDPIAGSATGTADRRARRSNETATRSLSESLWAPLSVDSDHCDTGSQQCGLAALYEFGTTSLPVGNQNGVIRPSLVVFIGEGVRGLAVFEEIGRTYMALERCSFRPGYVCRAEFHLLDEVSGYGSPPLYSLDPGLPPNADSEFDDGEVFGDVGTATMNSYKVEDRETNSDGSVCRKKKKRKKRKKGDKSKKKVKGNKKKRAAKKTVKTSAKGTAADVVNPTDLGVSTTMRSAFRIPAGSTGLAMASVSGTRGFLWLCSSAAEPLIHQVQRAGHAIDDSVHFMPVPVVDAQPLTAQENILFVTIGMLWLLHSRLEWMH